MNGLCTETNNFDCYHNHQWNNNTKLMPYESQHNTFTEINDKLTDELYQCVLNGENLPMKKFIKSMDNPVDVDMVKKLLKDIEIKIKSNNRLQVLLDLTLKNIHHFFVIGAGVDYFYNKKKDIILVLDFINTTLTLKDYDKIDQSYRKIISNAFNYFDQNINDEEINDIIELEKALIHEPNIYYDHQIDLQKYNQKYKNIG